jgi:hypothetical protein
MRDRRGRREESVATGAQTGIGPLRLGAAGLIAVLFLAAASGAKAAPNPPPADTKAVELPPPRPASPQPQASVLKEGLAVRYYFNRFNHLRELEGWMDADEGQPGPPLPALNYRSGIGNVLTAGAADMVGARIDGFIHLAKAGEYRFLVTSNDGIRLRIGGVMMHEDPSIHGDTTSPPLVFKVAEPGWYPLEILYFEKKGTSTLELYWRTPTGDSDEPVPAAAFKHQ